MLLANQDARFLNRLYLQKKMMKKPLFFACLYRFMEIKYRSKNIEVGVIRNGCGHSSLRTPKLAVSQEGN